MSLTRGLAAILAGLMIWAGGSDMARAGTVQGTASYRERIAVMPGSVLEVSLLDVSLADAPAVVLSSQRFALDGVPAEFQLTYDDALIKDRMRYVVRASIYNGRKLLFTTDTAYPVLTNGAGDTVDLLLVKVPAKQPKHEVKLENTNWSAVELNGQALDVENGPELSFAQGGMVGGISGCNRFTGLAKIHGDRLRFPDNMAATMRACIPPYDEIEKEFLEALASVETYSVDDKGQLVLVNAAGDAVLRFEAM
ncbi:hypothetical protein AVO45_10775 [Ruegeria marisrubri]|uniref:DUF306 domain-containing protein n=2 Tax=Ruegeria marisrubri TaxID=1685379 RepID=A0A0X3TMW2_9RHOB|nr:hypothetical protein AVO45_10775 [Ruegeria marisrubri]